MKGSPLAPALFGGQIKNLLGEAAAGGICGWQGRVLIGGIRGRFGGRLALGLTGGILDAMELVYFVGFGEASELRPVRGRLGNFLQKVLVFAVEVKDLHQLGVRIVDQLLAIAER